MELVRARGDVVSAGAALELALTVARCVRTRAFVATRQAKTNISVPIARAERI